MYGARRSPAAHWRCTDCPGTSTFPGGTCIVLTTLGGTEIANRFIAFYVFVKSDNRTYFVEYENASSQILSLGIVG